MKERINREDGTSETVTLLCGESADGITVFTLPPPRPESVGSVDVALYLTGHDFSRTDDLPPVCDGVVPLWQLVYHGIILSTPSARKMRNAVLHDWNAFLRNVEYGGRPVVCFNQKFYGSTPKPGETVNSDMLCGTDEELRDSVAKIKRLCEEYEKNRLSSGVFHDETHEDRRRTVCGSLFRRQPRNGRLPERKLHSSSREKLTVRLFPHRRRASQ